METVNDQDDPPPGCTTDPFQVAETQPLHGELALLLYFLMSYGHDLLGEIGRNRYFSMLDILAVMRNVMATMERLVHLEGEIWSDVVANMEPCQLVLCVTRPSCCLTPMLI